METLEIFTKHRPKCKKNTIQNYVTYFTILQKILPFELNVENIRKFHKKIYETIRKRYALTTQKLMLCLLLFYTNTKIKRICEYIDIVKKQIIEQRGKKTKKEEENWIEHAELCNIISTKFKNMTQYNKQELLNYVVCALYCYIPRRLDFSDVIIVHTSRHEKIKDKTKNFLVVATDNSLTFVMNNYKTSKKYGTQFITVKNEMLKHILSHFIKNIKNRNTMFSFGNKKFHRNSLCMLLKQASKKIFGKSISSTLFRKIYVSAAHKKVKENATRMGHSVITQAKFYDKG